MGKLSKTKKNKVPRLTEAEYADYVNSLKTLEQQCIQTPKKEVGVENKGNA